MNRNVEVKARVADLAAVAGIAGQLADGGPVILEQEDTFFQSPQGRLKLRCTGDGAPAELIFYGVGMRPGPRSPGTSSIVPPTPRGFSLCYRPLLTSGLSFANGARFTSSVPRECTWMRSRGWDGLSSLRSSFGRARIPPRASPSPTISWQSWASHGTSSSKEPTSIYCSTSSYRGGAR